MTLEPVIPISAIEHFAYCPRQCALIHCDGIWSDNAHTVTGTRKHRRVDSGQSRKERGREVLRSVPLWSEALGLTGRADVVEMTDGAVRPVEYKSGVRHGMAADMQVCAQALCLEEMLGVDVPHGFVWYGGPKRRFRVEFTQDLRAQVLEAIHAIRRQILEAELPPAVDDSRCKACQLNAHCLPMLVHAPGKVRLYVDNVVFSCAT